MTTTPSTAPFKAGDKVIRRERKLTIIQVRDADAYCKTDDGFMDWEDLSDLALLSAQSSGTDAAKAVALYEALRDAILRSAWKHEGDDSYSQGMDVGARHQIEATVKAFDEAFRTLTKDNPNG